MRIVQRTIANLVLAEALACCLTFSGAWLAAASVAPADAAAPAGSAASDERPGPTQPQPSAPTATEAAQDPTQAVPAGETSAVTGGYVPLEPSRIVDSRTGQGISGRLPQRDARGFNVRGQAGVAADASAVVLNAVATEAIGAGWLVLYPCDSPVPLASSVNFGPGTSVANQVTVGLGKASAAGDICAYASVEVHLVVDVSGYFPVGSSFRPTAPQRLADTRPGTPAPGAKGKIGGDGAVLHVKVAGANNVAASARVAVVNVTVTEPQLAGYVSIYPCGAERPLASMLNYAAGQTVANAATTGLGTDGTICVYSSQTTHAVVDLSGWFAAGSTVSTRVPVRVADTRLGELSGWTKGALAAQQVFEFPVVGVAGVPNGATSALLNLTVVNPQSAGWALVYPCQASRPLASNINFSAGATVAVSVAAVISPRGTVCVAGNATADLVIDLVGHYPGTPRLPASGSSFLQAEGVSQVFAAEPNGSVLPVSASQLSALGNPRVTIYQNPPGTRYERATWSPAAVFAVEPGGVSRRITQTQWIAALTPPIRTVPMVSGSTVQRTPNSPTLYLVAPDGQYLQLTEAAYRALGSPNVVIVIAVPGSRFVKTERSPVVYAMAPDGTTRALSANEFALIGSPPVETLPWRTTQRAVSANDLWASYRPGCPVGPSSLVRLEIPFWDFNGRLQAGAVVVARSAAGTIETTMRSAFDAHFPLRQITPIEQYRGSDEASMAADNSSAFNCRPVVGNPSRLSQHSFGNAIDFNPVENPYVTSSRVYPPGSQTYLDRSWRRPGMLYAGDPIVGPLTGAGWWWGARWSLPDYQHFSSNGG